MDYYDTCIRRVLAVTMYVGGPLAYGLMAYILSHAV